MDNIKDKDVIIFSFITSRLADYAEKTGNYPTGVKILKSTIEYIDKVKEDEALFGLNHTENKHTFTSFTCDNNKIYNLTKEIDKRYEKYVKDLNLKRRVNYRTEMKLKKNDDISKVKLDWDEIKEENFEINYLEGEYSKKIAKFNAVEKLLQQVKGTKLDDSKSNNKFI